MYMKEKEIIDLFSDMKLVCVIKLDPPTLFGAWLTDRMFVGGSLTEPQDLIKIESYKVSPSFMACLTLYCVCDVICKKVPYGGINIVGPGQTLGVTCSIGGLQYFSLLSIYSQHFCRSLCSVNCNTITYR